MCLRKTNKCILLIAALLSLLLIAQWGDAHEVMKDTKLPRLQNNGKNKSDDFKDKGEAQNSCLSCHKGIETIRPPDAQMFRGILSLAEISGTNNRCIVCHGGNPDIKRAEHIEKGSEQYKKLTEKAHSFTSSYFLTHPGPKEFYPDPGSPWISEDTCGLCHQWEVKAQWKSLMMTEAGKIQGTAWGFGGLSGYEHKWANYDIHNPKNEIVGTELYQAYMKSLKKSQGNVFVDTMTELPKAPEGGEDVTQDPSLAAFTYLRGECQRCHLAVGGKRRYGDYRGMGCSACHIPYSNYGYYQGEDEAINRTEPGHPLVHTMQSTAKSTVNVGETAYTGIPVETCTTCHNRGRRIGVSFQGLMETPYTSPWDANGEPQQKLHGKHYTQLTKDLHNRKGFMCQDCHTTIDVHSDNHLAGAIAAAVEIECTDCHGTPKKYPWELPIGFGDEYEEKPKGGSPRGLAKTLPDYMQNGTIHPPEDGYLLSARGNPLGNVVKSGNQVTVYLAAGEVKKLTPLKLHSAKGDFTLPGKIAMEQTAKHLDRMECYGCHATWAPQCYGCHLKIDYSKKKETNDWVQLGHDHRSDGLTKEYTHEGEQHTIPGEVTETRSYLRWEDPALAQNGEGRISPVIPGCQTAVTVINRKGEVLLLNHIFRIKNVEGAGEEGQLGIDMSPLHPHTVQKEARKCETCHNNPKALGYGIAAGNFYADPSKDHFVDLVTDQGKVIPQMTTPQVTRIPNLSYDWSRFVSEDGKQLQTVGHHFKLSRPLSTKERRHMEREGVCLACHKEIPRQSLAVTILHHIAAVTGLLPKTNKQHSALLHKSLLLAGWVQVLGIAFGVSVALILVYWRCKKRRKG